jgi:N-acetyl sugar amidotransferase
MNRQGRVCTFCVMDDSVPTITFDAHGRCNCCTSALARLPHEWWPNEEGERRMQAMAERLRAAGRGKPYDCMVGLSGGIDSAYLAHLAVRKLGLRVLAVHVDGGWNSEPAVCNIESLVRHLGLDLHTYVVEWREMRDLQLAFLRASVQNQDIPQDHAFFSTLYRTAMRYGLRYFLSGVNFASESIIPPAWGHPYMDTRHIRALHARFGSVPLETYPFMGLLEFLWYSRVTRRLTVFRPLNYMAYDKEKAKEELSHSYDWKDYGGKHQESRFTKFYQDIYLPRKYDFDKRRLHLSSLIVSGQMTREMAFAELKTPLVLPEQERRDIRFVAKKLQVPAAELENLLARPPVPHRQYPGSASLYAAIAGVRGTLRRIIGLRTV